MEDDISRLQSDSYLLDDYDRKTLAISLLGLERRNTNIDDIFIQNMRIINQKYGYEYTEIISLLNKIPEAAGSIISRYVPFLFGMEKPLLEDYTGEIDSLFSHISLQENF